jgi:PAS domain S-box-containing protein
MTTNHDSIQDKLNAHIARLLGYRLLGWAVVSLWATAILGMLRLSRDFAPAVDNWLLWITPLIVARGIAGAHIHKNLQKGGCFFPPLSALERLSVLFGLSDGLLLLSALVILGGAHTLGWDALVIAAMAILALVSLVYMFTPRVVALVAVVSLAPSLAAALWLHLALPWELIAMGCLILLATLYGGQRFRRLYLAQLRDLYVFEQRVDEASESNFIFNQHWQKTPVAAIDWDRELNIRSWNPAAEKLFGFTAAEALGSSVELIFPPDQAELVRRQWLQGENAKQGAMLRNNCRSDGSGVVAEWYDTPLTLEGEFIGIASFVVARPKQVPLSVEPQAKAQKRSLASSVVALH